MRALLLAALVACTSAQRTTGLLAASTATLAVDWRQTGGYIASCSESNPLLGSCGDRIPLNIYFPAVILLNAGLGLLLPRPWGDYSMAVMAGVEGATVLYNADIP